MNKILDKIDEMLTFRGMFSLLLAMLMVFSIMGMATPVSAITVDQSKVNYEKPIVVSMGDSYSSGEGIENFYDQDLSNKEKVESEDWLAHRSERSWPGMLKIPGLDGFIRDYKGTNWFFVASSGAKTVDLNYEQKKDYSRGAVGQYSDTVYLKPQLDIFNQLPENSVDYVTLTLGGNDADFTGVITEAVMGSTYLNTSKLADMLADIWDDYYKKDGIRDALYQSYKDIEDAAGTQAQIIVAGYPTLLDQTGRGIFFSKEEAKQINQAVRNFNIEIERLVEQCANEGMKICFVSVESAFDGHEADSRTPYISSVHIGAKDEDLKNIMKASAYSMHPNYDGAVQYAKCVNNKIAALEEEKALNPSPKDREVILVLDGSGSMSGTPMRETKEAAHRFVNTVLETETNVGIVVYDDYATVSSPLTDSKNYLNNAIDDIYASGGTNIEDGLKMADDMLSTSKAKKKIIVLMSDGEPNEGRVGQDLIDYADELKEKGYYIYTLGFFSNSYGVSSAQRLMEGIASEGCHFEVTDAETLQFFFGDIADQISGVKYYYIRIACPVDVTVTYKGEKMTSKDNYSSVRTSFGTMTFEDNPEEDSTGDNDNRIKILRLKAGVSYDIQIEGNGKGRMKYTIGFMDEDGEYSDMRTFSNIKITKRTEIETVAEESGRTYMYVDEDGDGKYDKTYFANEDSKAKLVDYTPFIYGGLAIVAAIALIIFVRKMIEHLKIKKYLIAT